MEGCLGEVEGTAGYRCVSHQVPRSGPRRWVRGRRHHRAPDRLPGLGRQRCGEGNSEQGTRVASTREPPTAIGGMMAAIFLVLAMLDAVLLGNVALANTSLGSVSVFDQSIGGFTQGELLLLAAGLGLLLALFLGIAWSSSSARRAKRRGLRAARREVEGRVVELERENARLRKGAGGCPADRRAGGAAGGVQPGPLASHPGHRARGGAGPAPTCHPGRGSWSGMRRAVAPSGRWPHQAVPGRPYRRGVRWVCHAAPAGPCLPARWVGRSPAGRPRAVTPGDPAEDAPARGDHHRARLGDRQGPQVQLLAQARRCSPMHPADLRLALPGVPHPRAAVLQPRRAAVPGARHRAAGGGAGAAVAGQGDDEGRHRPSRGRP
jgi:hypothetical protein